MSSSRALDQFFTRHDVANACFRKLLALKNFDCSKWLWVEPSAGAGAFLDILPAPKIGLDILPQRRDISCADYLQWLPRHSNFKIAVVGNPPFGKNASLARKFFDHSANFADVIAFIVPRTFQKPSFVNRLDRQMHLVFEEVLAEESFEFEGLPYAVPTVFQIWEKRRMQRPLTILNKHHKDFAFVDSRDAHFAFQRVGARAGLVSREGLRKSPQSHYFLKSNIATQALFERLHDIDWNPIKWRTAGNPSIGKGELIATYQAAFG
jgi:hypothetical protein